MQPKSQFSLLAQRCFAPLYWTQFFGALNDNIVKNALIIMINYQLLSWGSIDSSVLVNLCGAIFILPFFLFSSIAGQLADRYEKSRLIRWIKILEIVIMCLVALGFYWHSLSVLLVALFLLGMQSASFGPVKYSIIPQHINDDELVGANGLVEMGTFLAIILGTLAGGLLIMLPQGQAIVALVCMIVALLGYAASRSIPQAESLVDSFRIHWDPITTTWRNIQFARKSKVVFRSILGISWFWFYGAFFLAQLPSYVKLDLMGDGHVVTLFLALFSVGIGIGSLLCEKISGHVIEIGLVPFGSIGLSVFAMDLFFATPQLSSSHLLSVAGLLSSSVYYHVMLDFFLIGIFGGIYIVPLYTLIQDRGDKATLSRIISANNIFNALFIVLSAGVAVGLLQLGMTIPQLFLTVGLLNIVVALYIYTLVPEFLMRFLIWILISILYRVRKEDLDNIPDRGAAVLVCNHISFIDPLVIAASCKRPIRFVMDHNIFKIPVLNFIFRTANAIPVAPAKVDAKVKEQAFIDVAKALQRGELVAIFPEGMITYDGELNVFKPGIDEIIRTTPVPVIPLALRGLWGSFFSRKHGRAMSRFPKRIFYKIALVAGKAIPANEVSSKTLYERVLALRGDWK